MSCHRQEILPCHGYKAFVAINNAGVSLLKLNRNREASVTFRDALHVMKAIARCDESKEIDDSKCSSEPTESNRLTDDKLHELVNNASKLLAQSSSPSSKPPPTHPSLKVCEVSDDASPFMIINSNSRKGNESRVMNDDLTLFAIRIESQFEETDGIQDYLDMMSAIVLYNYAIASRCFADEILLEAMLVASSKIDEANSMRLKAARALDMSYRFFRMSFSILSNCRREYDALSTDNTSSSVTKHSYLGQNMDRLLLVSILVVQQIRHMIVTGNHASNLECEMYSHCLLNLVTMVNTNMNKSCTMIFKSGAASAA